MWTPPPHGPGSLNKWKGESEPSTSVQLSASWQLIHVSRCIELLLAQSSPTMDCIPLNHEPEQTLHFLKWFVRDFLSHKQGKVTNTLLRYPIHVIPNKHFPFDSLPILLLETTEFKAAMVRFTQNKLSSPNPWSLLGLFPLFSRLGCPELCIHEIQNGTRISAIKIAINSHSINTGSTW